MFKKVITSCLALVWVSSLALAGYRMFEPKAAAAVVDNKVASVSMNAPQARMASQADVTVNNDTAPTAENKQALGSEEGIHYYFFCVPDDADCTYINDYVFKPLTVILEVEQIDIIEFVDINSLSKEWTPARLKNQWGFDNYPAFVATETVNGEKNILSVLQWNSENPLDSDDLKNWMIENNIWSGPIEEQGELIEQPNG